MAFKATVSENLSEFKSAFGAINNIMEGIEIQVDSGGLRLSALDRSHIMYSDLNLLPSFFDEFEVDEPLRLTLDTGEFAKVLKRCTGDDSFVMKSDGSTLEISYSRWAFSTSHRGDWTGERKFHIKILDEDYAPPKAPDFDTPAKFNVPTIWFGDLLKDAGIVSDKLKFTCTPKGLFISSVDGEYSDSRSSCDVAEFGWTVPKEQVSSSYSLEKLKDIMKAEAFSDKIQIGLGTNVPLALAFKKIDGLDVIGEISFILAPRIENEED